LEDWNDAKTMNIKGNELFYEHRFAKAETYYRRALDLNPELAKRLTATGHRKIIEGNYWGDTFWGVCKGIGENHMGKIIMQTRGELYG
jgi:predicted NAD-dependent protein-ADP-ribosyltransferase YbiA (DUF1768 family)